jgi:CRISPR/Cas system-associated endoribonuclease Cas2
VSQVRQAISMYLLIFDLKGGSTAQRRRVNRFLVRTAHRVQQSAWEFDNMRALETAVKLVTEAGGRSIAFVKSDRLLLDMSEVRQVLKEMSYVRHRNKSPVSGETSRGLKNVSGETKCLS